MHRRALIAAARCAAGLAWTFVPPGTEKAGRILIDDRFCGIWEPTARQLDTRLVRRFPDLQLHFARRMAGEMVFGRRQHIAAL